MLYSVFLQPKFQSGCCCGNELPAGVNQNHLSWAMPYRVSLAFFPEASFSWDVGRSHAAILTQAPVQSWIHERTSTHGALLDYWWIVAGIYTLPFPFPGKTILWCTPGGCMLEVPAPFLMVVDQLNITGMDWLLLPSILPPPDYTPVPWDYSPK